MFRVPRNGRGPKSDKQIPHLPTPSHRLLFIPSAAGRWVVKTLIFTAIHFIFCMQRTASFIVYLGFLLCGLAVCSTSLQAQAPKKNTEVPSGFLPGYALNGHDTIRCKLAFDHSFPYPDRADQITIDFDGEVMTFEAADGLITGFGVQEAGKWFEYGLIMDSFNGRKKTGYFAKKLVAGSIDLYEQHVDTELSVPKGYNNGQAENQAWAKSPGGLVGGNYSIKGTAKKYYMGKYSTGDTGFVNPVQLPAMKKEWLAPFIADYPALLETIPEKFSKKELTRFIEEYNYWKGKNMR